MEIIVIITTNALIDAVLKKCAVLTPIANQSVKKTKIVLVRNVAAIACASIMQCVTSRKKTETFARPTQSVTVNTAPKTTQSAPVFQKSLFQV